MPEESLQERTEEATPRRREEARKRGQVPKSRELTSVAVLLTGSIFIFFFGGFFITQIIFLFKFSFSFFTRPIDFIDLLYLLKAIFPVLLKILLPLFLFLSLGVLLVYFVQTGGGLWATEVLTPKLERINPIEGFKRLFSLTSLFELIKSLLKLFIISGISYWILREELPKIIAFFGNTVNHLTIVLLQLVKSLIVKIFFLLLLLSILDWLFNWWEVERKLKMTREELKEELKQTEGDPLVKMRIRQKQREMARLRMLEEVPKADVVITNPEHFAVALKYIIGEMPAPQVIAKGVDHLAQKIKEIAIENNIPLYEDPPLARLLYYKTKVGDYIPSELYEVVAKVLALIYRMRKKRGPF